MEARKKKGLGVASLSTTTTTSYTHTASRWKTMQQYTKLNWKPYTKHVSIWMITMTSYVKILPDSQAALKSLDSIDFKSTIALKTAEALENLKWQVKDV